MKRTARVVVGGGAGGRKTGKAVEVTPPAVVEANGNAGTLQAAAGQVAPAEAAAGGALQPAETEARLREIKVHLQLWALPERLQRSLKKELGPDEQVEWIAMPRRDQLTRVRWSLLGWAGAFSVLLLAAGMTGNWEASMLWWIWSGGATMALAALHSMRRANRHEAFVVTNQRCFRLSPLGLFGVRVDDVSAVPKGTDLAPEDLLELRDRIAALGDQTPALEARQEAENARIMSQLPVRQREALHHTLEPGETVRWLCRPTLNDYFAHAPVDFLTTLVVSLAGLETIAAILGLLGGVLGFALSSGAVAAALWTYIGLTLRHHVTGTLYAVTDRRGLVIGRGGKATRHDFSRLRAFQRTQDAQGRGNLAPSTGGIGEGFYGVRNVKIVDDLIKGRPTADRSTEVAPSLGPDGRGDELSPTGEERVNG